MPTKQELAAFKARLLEAIQKLERKKKTRLSQTDLADRWKVSQASVSVWVSGKAIPTREQIKRIAGDAGVDPGWLDYGTAPASPSTPVDNGGEEEAVG